jgi:hypothetical protein
MAEEHRAEEAFDRIASGFRGRPGVTEGTGFGSNPGLRVGGRIFAMLSRGSLVVKLPAGRVGEIVGSGIAEPFDAGKGRPMKEWAAIPPGSVEQWEGIAQEAFEFVQKSGR